MMALAVILGTLQWTGSFALIPSFYETDIHDKIVLLALGHALVAWAALWAALGVPATAHRMVVFALAALVAYGFTPTTLFHFDPSSGSLSSSFPPSGIPILPEAALLLGSLWIFRLAGYRVVFRKVRGAIAGSPIDSEAGDRTLKEGEDG